MGANRKGVRGKHFAARLPHMNDRHAVAGGPVGTGAARSAPQNESPNAKRNPYFISALHLGALPPVAGNGASRNHINAITLDNG